MNGLNFKTASLHKRLPHLSETGAVVGGWQTKVRALLMETSAMGGDIQVWIQGSNINIGLHR